MRHFVALVARRSRAAEGQRVRGAAARAGTAGSGYARRMELREFAERVLYGGALADKILPPGVLSDASPGAACALERPHRPAELRFSPARIRDVLPRDLENPVSRGELLHRFANHELLALEIMASTLLRFPDAPLGFRAGLARTMMEEQEHLGLYLGRMRALGVEPGGVPVNDFFWRCTESMTGPYDYVLRMALTFEQANLDFTQFWIGRFAEAGDAPTAAVLERVYADEIGHVRGGLRLFREWKPADLDEWTAFERGLSLPLSPARARGDVVDREGRRRAGFTERWIDRLERTPRARGRAPDVWAFNPGCEEEVGGATRGGPVASAVEADLAPLLALVAREDDVVLCPRLPSPEWSDTLRSAGLSVPEWCPGASVLGSRRVAALRPWGRSPAVGARFAGLPGADVLWAPGMAAAFDKAEAWRWRAEFLATDAPDWWVDGDGELCQTLGAVEAAAARGWVIKAPFSTAGRGRRRGALDAGGRAWAARVLGEDGVIRAEPWRDRVADLSFHLDIGVEPRFVGVVRFDTTPSGQFIGTRPGRWLQREPEAIRRFCFGDGRDPRRLVELGERLARFLGPKLSACGISGPVGVDTMIVDDGSGLRLDPLLEVNPRLTMGRLSLALERKIHPQSVADWRFVSLRNGRPAEGGAASFAARPPVLVDGLLRSGLLCTNDPSQATHILTVLDIRA